MAVKIEITTPEKHTDAMVSFFKSRKDVMSLSVQKDISIEPKGDIIAVLVSNRSQEQIVRYLQEEFGLTDKLKLSLTISRPKAIISRRWRESLASDSSESTWEEMENSMGEQSNMTLYVLLIMFFSGFIAAAGLITDVIHYVIAAMTIAPGFDPFVRLGLGLALRSRAAYRGFFQIIKGYTSFILGATLSALIFRISGGYVLSGISYLPSNTLIQYWSTISPLFILVVVIAAIVGTILIITNRGVLTIGVMIALSLIPSGAMIGISIVNTDMSLFSIGISRFLIESIIIIAISWIVFFLKRKFSYYRKTTY